MQADFLDRYSRLDSPVHRLPTGAKLAAALALVVAAVALPRSQAICLAALVLATASTLCGLWWSVAQDMPTNQSIAVAACGCFLLVFPDRVVRWSVERALFWLGSHSAGHDIGTDVP